MTRYAFGVSYDGSDFHGWQRQPDLPTVQASLESALSKVANHPVSLMVAGRTDAGVHATGQVVAFDSAADRTPWDWRRGANALTPASVQVDWLQAVDADFHPRYDATSRRYHYLFADQASSPLWRGQVWQTDNLDVDAMHRAAQTLLGEQDFTSFRGAGCQSISPMRRVDHCVVRRLGQLVVLDIAANAFLLHMVRNIASALEEVGQGQQQRSLRELVALRDRRQAPATAPPQGLYLTHVGYSDSTLPDGQLPPWLPTA